MKVAGFRRMTDGGGRSAPDQRQLSPPDSPDMTRSDHHSPSPATRLLPTIAIYCHPLPLSLPPSLLLPSSANPLATLVISLYLPPTPLDCNCSEIVVTIIHEKRRGQDFIFDERGDVEAGIVGIPRGVFCATKGTYFWLHIFGTRDATVRDNDVLLFYARYFALALRSLPSIMHGN
uniref:Uncharacterized protein n=1 Tax=Plectus sambesii TaxID=2011161 RepID=A0A914X6I0_9BILA